MDPLRSAYFLLGRLLPAVLLWLPVGALPDSLPTKPLEWISDHDVGLEQARTLHKPAFIYFDAPWCSWCQRYQQDTLSHPSVMLRLQHDYISILIDYDVRPDLFRRYRGRGLPFTVMTDGGGQVLNRFTGAMAAGDLMDVLERFAAGERATAPSPALLSDTVRIIALERGAYQRFRHAFLGHVDGLYDPATGILAGGFETGTTLKRPSPLTWWYLMDDAAWRQRSVTAATAEAKRLLDKYDGGFFNFIDPDPGDYLETSKLLEVNAWLTAWLGRAGLTNPSARDAARSGWFYLREVLWDKHQGGFFQAQRADNKYYAMPLAIRLRASPPAIEPVKRTDTNAQAVWALADYARASGNPQPGEYAVRTMDFLLREMIRGDRVYHVWRAGEVSVPAALQDTWWLLAAGSQVEAIAPDATRRRLLNRVAKAAMASIKASDLTTLVAGSNELAGLVAWVAQQREMYPLFNGAIHEAALRQLYLAPDTPPDELVFGLWAWESALSASRR